jgi:Tfp pilus assembly protein PilN
MNALIVPLLAVALVVALLALAIVLFRWSGGEAGLAAASLEKQIERIERELRTAIESSSGYLEALEREASEVEIQRNKV